MRPLAFMAGLLLLQATYASAENLTLSKGPAAGDVTLTWTGGVGSAEVFRANSPQNIYDQLDRIAFTTGASWTDQPPAASIVYYGVSDSRSPFFSEYVEGSLSNKALEIKNPLVGTFDLGACSIRTYPNGSTTPTTLQLPSAVIQSGDVYVVCNSASSMAMQPLCDMLAIGTALGFTGDDAIELFCAGATYDVIGQIGFDPGSEWASGGVSTGDETLVRKCGIVRGDVNGADAFAPSVEWSGLPVDTYSGLGDPACAP